ncbi:MAG TPA: hypothetical protein VGZ00_08215 [Candidatus Baltobacteraceae bacterium]|jgi:hypothetical protein|nr:hypothetical protein [Candidatus Baltobacteraceae bacterium]
MSDQDPLLAVQSYSGKTSLDTETALDITHLPAFSQSGNERIKELVKALNIIAQHAHIQVDIGKGSRDAFDYSLQAFKYDIAGTAFPLVIQRASNAPLEWWDEPNPPNDLSHVEFLKDILLQLKARYRVFPDLVNALDHMGKVAEHPQEVRLFFRDNLTPEQMAQLKQMYYANFSRAKRVTVQQTETVNEQGQLKSQQVQRAFQIRK